MIVFHLHIPRTGGSTMGRALTTGFTRDRVIKYRSVDQVASDPKMNNDLLAVTGHYRWGLHDRFSREHLYFIILRDPVQRAASLYDYVRVRVGHKSQPRWAQTPLSELSLDEWRSAQLSNGQVSQLAGRELVKRNTPLPEQLERAWDHISQGNVIVTTTEDLNDGLKRLGERTGITFKPITRRHNSAERSPLSEETLSLLRERNTFDTELYNRAKAALIPGNRDAAHAGR